jgi:hypothetical protein
VTDELTTFIPTVMTPEEFASRLNALARGNSTGLASRMHTKKVPAVIAAGIAAELHVGCDDESIELFLIRDAVRHPRHYRENSWSGLSSLAALEMITTPTTTQTKSRKKRNS